LEDREWRWAMNCTWVRYIASGLVQHALDCFCRVGVARPHDTH